VLLVSSSALGRTWSVRPDGTGDVPTIQVAADSARAGDEVVLENGVFRGSGNRDVHWHADSVAIRSSGGDPAACIVDCEGAARGFDFPSVIWVAVEGITIRNGRADDGAGVYCDDAYVAFNNCVFASNQARFAVYLDLAYATFANCMFHDNSWILYEDDGDAEFTDCTIFHNPGLVDLEHDGGISLTRCAVYDNAGDFYVDDSVARASSCTFWRNNSCPALFELDEMYGYGDDLRFTNCIFANSYHGSTVHASTENRTIHISCTDIYGNQGGDWVWPIAGFNGHSNFSACPSFCEAEFADFHLCSTSPCLPGNHPAGYNCGLIGVLGQGCACGPSKTEGTTWGHIKAQFK